MSLIRAAHTNRSNMDVHEVIIITQKDQELRTCDLADFDELCRVCLAECGGETASRNIHAEEAQMLIRSLIEVYTFVKIPEFVDSLPQRICEKCLAFLVDVHMFRSRCRLNNDLLVKVQRQQRAAPTTTAKVELVKEETEEEVVPNAQTQALIDRINDERMGLFPCKDCELVFSGARALRAHRVATKHSRRAASACPHCARMFNTAALKAHVRTHTKERPFACTMCGAAFAIRTNLRRHVRIHVGERAFTCELCGKSFVRAESLAVHQRLHVPKRTSPTTAVTAAADGDAHVCPTCNKHYSSEEQLKVHMRYHRKTFLCNNCGKIFATKANLNTHLRVHTGERPFACTVCSKSFTQSSSLKTHMSTHDGAKPFACEFCGRRFSVRGNLRVHQRIHTGETPHHCAVCAKGFCTSSTLRKHLRKHAKDEVAELPAAQRTLAADDDDDDNDGIKFAAADTIFVEEQVEETPTFTDDGEHEIQVIYAVDDGIQEIVYQPQHVDEAEVELCIAEEDERVDDEDGGDLTPTTKYKVQVLKRT